MLGERFRSDFTTGGAMPSYNSHFLNVYQEKKSNTDLARNTIANFHLQRQRLGAPLEDEQYCFRRSNNVTESIPVPSSEHVAEIVGRQGCKIKALRAKTNTYIKTPSRGEKPVFLVTGRKDDVEAARAEIITAADHFSKIRATRRPSTGSAGNTVTGVKVKPQCAPKVGADGQINKLIPVPLNLVGLVVGPKGATIKRIQQETDTYIITPGREDASVFRVSGRPENVGKAEELILGYVNRRAKTPFSDMAGGDGFHDESFRGFAADGYSHFASSYLAPPDGEESVPSPILMDDVPSAMVSLQEMLNSFNLDTDLDGFPAPSCNSGLSHLLSRVGRDWSETEEGLSSISSPEGSSVQQLSPTLSYLWSSDMFNSTEQNLPPFYPYSPTVSTPLRRNPLPFGSRLPSSLESSTESSPLGLSMGLADVPRFCLMCHYNDAGAALAPCGHNFFCLECAEKLVKKPEESRKCPVCLQYVYQVYAID